MTCHILLGGKLGGGASRTATTIADNISRTGCGQSSRKLRAGARPLAVPEEDARWRAQLDELAGQVQRWTGNAAGIAEVGETEIKRLRSDGPPILEELRADAITIAGPDAQQLLGAR